MSDSRVGLRFNQALDPESAVSVNHYQAFGGVVSAAFRRQDPTMVFLEIAPADSVEAVRVDGVLSFSGESLTPAQFISVDRWMAGAEGVGETRRPGQAFSVARGDLDVEAVGQGFVGVLDELFFIHAFSGGDFDVLVKVISANFNTPAAQVGLMLRESMDPAARSFGVFGTQVSPSNRGQCVASVRSGKGLKAKSVGNVALGAAPHYWLRLARLGNRLRGYQSNDGWLWKQVGEFQMPAGGWGQRLLLGMFLASGDPLTLSGAHFAGYAAAAGPEITGAASEWVAALRGEARLVARVFGSQPMTLAWRKNGVILNPDERLSGLQSPELTLRDLRASDSALYSLIASNAFGVAVGGSVSLRVVSPPQILLAPAHQFAPFLSRVRFGAQIVPPAPAILMGPALGGLPGEDTHYQWLKDEVAIPGANEPVLVLTNVERRDVGFYSLLASNLAGSVQTDPAELQVCQTRHGLVTEGVIATPNRSSLATLESGGSGPALAGFSSPVVHLSHGVPLFFSASNGASEPGLSICGNPSSRTKWVGYFSARPDRFRFSTAGSDFDTVLGVYTNRLGKLMEVGCARGVSGPIGATLDLELARNVFYYVAVDGQAGASGVARLAIGGGLLQAPHANVLRDTFQLELVTLAQRRYTVRMSPHPDVPWILWTPVVIPAYPTDRDWVLPLSVSGLAAFPGRFIAAEEH